jgi:hypothetical protein
MLQRQLGHLNGRKIDHCQIYASNKACLPIRGLETAGLQLLRARSSLWERLYGAVP